MFNGRAQTRDVELTIHLRDIYESKISVCLLYTSDAADE